MVTINQQYHSIRNFYSPKYKLSLKNALSLEYDYIGWFRYFKFSFPTVLYRSYLT